MARTKEIALLDSFPGHNGPVTRVVLREPTGWDYAQLGEPTVVARNPDGTVYIVENDATIAAYFERCIAEPDPLLFKTQISMADMMSVKAALLDFFTDARQRRSPNTST